MSPVGDPSPLHAAYSQGVRDALAGVPDQELEAVWSTGVEQGLREALAELLTAARSTDRPGVTDSAAKLRERVGVLARRIRAMALREYADRHHPRSEDVEAHTDYGTGVDRDEVCTGCGAAWHSDGEHPGCAERQQLLADAATIEAGTLFWVRTVLRREEARG